MKVYLVTCTEDGSLNSFVAYVSKEDADREAARLNIRETNVETSMDYHYSVYETVVIMGNSSDSIMNWG